MAKKLSPTPPPPPQPKKKTFRLDDYACKQLAEIQATYGMATENEAINYVLQSYLKTVEILRLTGASERRLTEELEEFWEAAGSAASFIKRIMKES